MTDTDAERRFDEFHDAFVVCIKRRDYAAAESLCLSYIAVAQDANDPENASFFAGFLANVVAMAGRKDEALDAFERAESYVPTDAYHKITTASYLIWSLRRPEDGLAKLAEARPLLQRFGDWISWLNESGVAALALGRDEQAVECMRALSDPDRLTTMRQCWSLAYQVDLRLVERMTERQLATDACIAYLEIAEAIGLKSDEPHDKQALASVRELLDSVRAGA